jgi:hypothetical protein
MNVKRPLEFPSGISAAGNCREASTGRVNELDKPSALCPSGFRDASVMGHGQKGTEGRINSKAVRVLSFWDQKQASSIVS